MVVEKTALNQVNVRNIGNDAKEIIFFGKT